jgi:glycosyltransferase involved in cell wall biosynthesis
MQSRKKNIMYISSFGHLKWGGQKSLFCLVTNLDKTAFHPYVILPSDEDFARKLQKYKIDVIIQNFPSLTFYNIFSFFKALCRLSKIIDTHKISLIHTDGPRNTFYAGLAAMIKGIPLIFHVRSSDHDTYDRLLYVLSTKIILVANNLRSRFEWVTSNDKFITVYNGVDLAEFQIHNEPNNVRKEYGIDRDCIVIACIARIEISKGQHFLIEAMEEIRNQINTTHLLIVGDIFDEAYFNLCSKLVEEAGLKEQVTFTGHKENIPEILSDIDIFVLPSTAEAFPRTIIEAMSMGKPIIATNVGGSAEAFEEGISGITVPPADPVALANAIMILANDGTLRQKMGVAARKRVEQMFSIEQNARRTEQIYEKLLRK